MRLWPVTANEDGSVTVSDDGRGIPVGINHQIGRNAVDLVFTELHAGGKFGGGGYKVSGGLHGVGASVVNALSEWLDVKIKQNGTVYHQRFSRGRTTVPLEEIGTCDPTDTGSTVSFMPDPVMFKETTVFDYDILKQRMREMAFLTKGLRITLEDLRTEPSEEGEEPKKPRKHEFYFEGGIKEFVSYLNRSKTALYPEILYFEGTKNNVYVEVAFQHNDAYGDSEYSFVNNINTPEGGMHLVGFRNALTKTFNDYGRKNKIIKEILPKSSYNTVFIAEDGSDKSISVNATDWYLTGDAAAPEGITVIGGKTGTTDPAGHCLVLYSQNGSGNGYISVVMKTDTQEELYDSMNSLLSEIPN